MHERGLLPRRAHTTRQLLPHPALPSNRRSSRSSGCFAYLTQKVNSSTYYKSRDSRSKNSKEGDGADVLKEVPLRRGNRGTRGQLVSQGSQNSLFPTVPSPRLDSPTKVRAPLPALLAGIPATGSGFPVSQVPYPNPRQELTSLTCSQSLSLYCVLLPE